jgi:hypothetical protein
MRSPASFQTHYIGRHPAGYEISIGVHEDTIRLVIKKPTTHTFEITCTGPDSFEVAIERIKVGPTNRSGMARAVIQWAETHCPQNGEPNLLTRG